MIGLFNQFIAALGSVLGMFLNLLPDSPFQWNLVGNPLIAFIGWLIPIQIMITEMTLFVYAVGVYYGLRIILRWIKAAGD